MEIKADEITAILKQQLADYEKTIDVAEVGTVLSVGDGIARVYGLDKVAARLVDFGHDIFGLALDLEQTRSASSSANRSMSRRGRKSAGRAIRASGARARGPRRDARPPHDDKGPIEPPSPIPRAPRAGRHRPGVKGRATGIRRSTPRFRSAAASAGSSSATARPARRPSPSTRSSTRRAGVSSASTSSSGRRSRRSPRWQDPRGERGDGAHDHLGDRVDPTPMLYHCFAYAGCAIGEWFLYNKQHALVIYDDLSSTPHRCSRRCCCGAGPPGVSRRRSPALACSSGRPAIGREWGGSLPRSRSSDAGGRRLGVHPDQRHLDHRRPDLPENDLFYSGVPGGQRRHLVSRVGGNAQIRR
jgi:F-type H+-transporting ATPase subunit alpha